MACDTVQDWLTRESGRFMADLMERRVFGVSPWMSLMPRGEFPSGLGETISDLIYERSAPTEVEPSWANMTIADGSEGGLCLPPTVKVGIASSSRSFSLQRMAREGPDFCAEELRPAFSLGQQLENINGILLDYMKIEWEIKDRHDYFRATKYKVVVDNCHYQASTHTSTSAAAYPGTAATGQLPLGMLEDAHLLAVRDGGANSSMASDVGGPLSVIITSPETSRNIVNRDSAARTDLREAGPKDMNNLLFRRLGVRFSFKDFIFISDLFNRRFSFGGGAYTEIPAFALTAATKGTKAELNSSWLTATYEESFRFDPSVMVQLIPRPITNPAANFHFDPVNYTGVWKVMNIPDRECNPDGNILFHRAIAAASARVLHPERGFSFVHLRCDPECTLITSCS